MVTTPLRANYKAAFFKGCFVFTTVFENLFQMDFCLMEFACPPAGRKTSE